MATQPNPTYGKHLSLLACLLLSCVLLYGCEILTLERGLKQVRHGIEQADGLGMEEAALYHLNVARSLLDEAEKQYEEADFPTAEQFLDQSERQLQWARRLHTLSRTTPPPNASVRDSTLP